MPRKFTREMAKKVVSRALRAVADFSGKNIEEYVFKRFKTFHKEVFLSTLKKEIHSVNLDEHRYFDICLNEDSFKQWVTVGDCVEWVYENVVIRRAKTKKLSKTELKG